MTSPSSTVPAPTARRARAGYSAMRMVAEWASEIRGETLHFGFERRHATLSNEARHDTVPMHTRPFTTRPEVESVDFSVTFGGTVHTRRISARDHSALFWSESSVEKFLFPYFASVAAEGAGRFFRKLTNAWYRYHPDEVKVCAIAYGCPRCPPGKTRLTLTLERMVSLVCLVPRGDGYELELVPLDSFARRFPSRGPVGGERRPSAGTPIDLRRERGWNVNERVENIVARDAAEFMSGLRGHDVDFAAAGGELTPWVPIDRTAVEWFPCGMGAVRADRLAPSSVVLHLEGDGDAVPILPAAAAPAGDPAQEPDSLFWSDGAVEKLMVPYYGSVKGLAAPIFTTVLIGRWNGLLPGDPVIAPCGVLEAIRGFVGTAADPDDGPTDAAATDDDTPYAVTHLPRSEYIPDSPATSALEARTRFHTLANHGGQRLSHFTAGW